MTPLRIDRLGRRETPAGSVTATLRGTTHLMAHGLALTLNLHDLRSGLDP